MQVFLFFCYISTLWNCVLSAQTQIIRHRRSNKHYAMGNVLSQLAVTSVLDCAQSRASKDDSQGSMLQGNLCVLYQKARCLCPLASTVPLNPGLPSRYQIAYSAERMERRDARRVCKAQNMELLAINSKLEQDKVAELIKGFCEFTHLRSFLKI